MHEMSLCQSLIELLESERAAQGFQSVTRVRLAIGAFSNVEPDALRFGFAAASPGTVADGAQLELEMVPASVWCMSCGETRTITRRGDACPECGSSQLILQSGEEMRLSELEVH